jgi:hypothetical protein
MKGAAQDAAAGTKQLVSIVRRCHYLAVQLRQTTHQVRLSTASPVASFLQDGFAPPYQDANARIFRLGLFHPDQLTEDEQFVFALLMARQFNNFAVAVYQRRQGAPAPELFNAMPPCFQSFLAAPGGKAWWIANCSGFAPHVRELLEGAVQGSGASGPRA